MATTTDLSFNSTEETIPIGLEVQTSHKFHISNIYSMNEGGQVHSSKKELPKSSIYFSTSFEKRQNSSGKTSFRVIVTFEDSNNVYNYWTQLKALHVKTVCYIQSQSQREGQKIEIVNSSEIFYCKVRTQFIFDPSNIISLETTVYQTLHIIDGIVQEIPVKKAFIPHEMSSLFNSEEMSDITITVGDKVFHAHKFVLAMRSTVFKAMLSAQMREGQKNRIEIKEMEPDVFQELLFYIYNNGVSSSEKVSFELYKAADMYDIPSLRDTCVFEIEKKVSFINAVEIANFAESMNNEGLRDQAYAFILKNKGKMDPKDLIECRKNVSFLEYMFDHTN